MTKELYIKDYYTKTTCGEYVPLRWMAPECISEGKFSKYSDVVRKAHNLISSVKITIPTGGPGPKLDDNAMTKA